MGALYTYGSQVIHYTNNSLDLAEEFAKLSKGERKDADIDPKLLVDFTTVITTPNDAKSEAMKKVAQTCRQGRASTLDAITPDKVHGGVKKATKFLICAMATERARFCSADERKLLVSQLMEYKERRMNAFAFEKYRSKKIAAHEAFRQEMRNQAAKSRHRLNFPRPSWTLKLMRPAAPAQEPGIQRIYQRGGFWVLRTLGPVRIRTSTE